MMVECSDCTPPVGPPELAPRSASATSTDPLVALSQLLDRARVAAGTRTLAIADDRGLLIAGAGSWASCEELAAWAPLLADGAANDTVPTRLDVLARRSEVRRLTIDGMRVYVCGEGGDALAAVQDALDSCRRVLSRPRADARGSAPWAAPRAPEARAR